MGIPAYKTTKIPLMQISTTFMMTTHQCRRRSKYQGHTVTEFPLYLRANTHNQNCI